MGTKILLVDDSPFTRQIVKKTLNGEGFREVIEAENSMEALRKYETYKPDIVILDIIMPDISGTEVLKQIMNIDKNAKVIILSAVGQKKMMNLCKKLGAVGYIIKPFEKMSLLNAVENALHVKRAGKTLTKLSNIDEDALREIGNIGAQHAAIALSKMTGETVEAKLLATKLASLSDLPKQVGDRETLVSGIYLPVTGDLSGSILMIFPEKSAFLLVDLMFKKNLGTTKELSEIAKSSLGEAGNILAGNCLTSLSESLGLNLVEHVPDFAHGMVGALIDNVAVAFGQKTEQALIMQMELKTKKEIKIVGYFFLMFTLKEARVILRTIKAKAGF